VVLDVLSLDFHGVPFVELTLSIYTLLYESARVAGRLYKPLFGSGSSLATRPASPGSSRRATLFGTIEPMKTDDAIAEAIRTGSYQANLETGEIRGPHGRILGPNFNKKGYPTVGIRQPGNRNNVNVLAHRLVAATGWGIDAIVGRQVAHRDGVKTNNALSNLWLPENEMEHYIHDQTIRSGWACGRKPKTSWDPCARCGDPDGQLHPGKPAARTPSRINGQRFGIEGSLCWRCYKLLYERERARIKKETALGRQLPKDAAYAAS
jgi:hypothetical protein